MIHYKERFLFELTSHLQNHPEIQFIQEEYEQHLDLLMAEDAFHSLQEDEKWSFILNRLGEPEYIAKLWNKELAITPSKTTWAFIFINLCFFLGGIILTIVNHFFDLDWIRVVWESLTSFTAVIIFLYLFFWILLGYEIGKEFGQGGKRLLVKTFLLSLLPNLVLMCLVVFHIIPHSWFEPFLSNTFIIMCITCTACLYPISFCGFYLGKRVSV